MSGIAGFTWGDQELVGRMLQRLVHRGPDSEGSYVAPEVSLGCRRLALTDASEHGNEPLCNEDRTLWAVLDGQIYNRHELRRRLEAKGHRFDGGSDAELALHAYEQYELDALRRFNGEFALAVWDSKRRQLVLARDRLGGRPLYYARRGAKLVFASEIKALLEWEELGREVDACALFDYLGFGFSPAPRTLLEGVWKLEPGHRLVVADGRLDDQAYWDVPIYHGNPTRREAEAQLISTLEEAVRLRLAGDVPLGLLLSGGLGSSLILSLTASLGAEVPRTFAFGYGREGASGLAQARQVARHFGAEHHDLLIEEVSPEDVREAAWALDEPLADLSVVPFHLLCREARTRTRVVLSGEGGDALLAGHDRFRKSRIESRLRILPDALRLGLLNALADRLPHGEGEGWLARLRRFAVGARLPREARHIRWRYFFLPEYGELLCDPSRGELAEHDAFAPVRRFWEASEHHRYLNRESYVDLKLILPDRSLLATDKLSMAHGLEVRLPFLDPDVVEMTAPFPPDWKLDGLRTKAILRSAAARYRLLPPDVLAHPREVSAAPARGWLRGPLRGLLVETLDGSRIVRELCAKPVLDRLVADHLAAKRDHGAILTALLGLAVWHELYVESPPHLATAGCDPRDRRESV